MSDTQNGWTDDMNITLPPGRTVEEFVKFVIEQGLSGICDEENENKLVATFGISQDDAALVRDRVFGGIVRAAMGNPSNKPNAVKDPFAYASYQYAKREPSIMQAFYPQFVQSNNRPWWKFWR